MSHGIPAAILVIVLMAIMGLALTTVLIKAHDTIVLPDQSRTVRCTEGDGHVIYEAKTASWLTDTIRQTQGRPFVYCTVE